MPPPIIIGGAIDVYATIKWDMLFLVILYGEIIMRIISVILVCCLCGQACGDFLTAFNYGMNSKVVRAKDIFSRVNNVGRGDVIYSGTAVVNSMCEFNGKLFSSLTFPSGMSELRVGRDINNAKVIYRGKEQISSMVVYRDKLWFVVHTKSGSKLIMSDGSGLYGKITHNGDLISAITVHNGFLYAGVAHGGKHSIYKSSDGRFVHRLYLGTSLVTALASYNNYLYAAFSNCGNRYGLHRVHISDGNTNPGDGKIVYEGISPVWSMAEHDGKLLTYFSNCKGILGRFRIHVSDGYDLGDGQIIYDNDTVISSMMSISTNSPNISNLALCVSGKCMSSVASAIANCSTYVGSIAHMAGGGPVVVGTAMVVHAKAGYDCVKLLA